MNFFLSTVTNMSPKYVARKDLAPMLVLLPILVFGLQRHRPEQTLLYQLVEEYYPAFVAQLAAQGTQLPGYVEREFEDYLKCGRLEHG
jgi:hypothetical protein